MKKNKGFTIVELVIVIAVIAILAAVLIPTFSNIVFKANLSNDMQNARNMNTALAIYHIEDGPVDNINLAKQVIKDANYGYSPKTTDHGYHYYWCEEDNQVYLILDQDSKFEIFFCEEKPVAETDNSWRLDLEWWTVECKIEGVTVSPKVFSKDVTSQVIELTGDKIPDGIYTNASKNEIKVDKINNTVNITSFPNSGNVLIISDDETDCLAKGTKITMADLSVKLIEDIKEGDTVLTFNHEKGVYEAKSVYLTWKSDTKKAPFTLNFSNGASLSIVGDHTLFCLEDLTYVDIYEYNAISFIGKHFYSVESQGYVELVSVTFEEDEVEYYEIYTEYNANCVAEGMLNVALDSSEILKIYTFNSDLTIDEASLANDISTYGLFEYPNDAEYSYELYDALGWKYAYVMVGKGFGTIEDFHNRVSAFLNEYR